MARKSSKKITIPSNHISVYIQAKVNAITKLSSWGYIIQKQNVELGRRVERLDTTQFTQLELSIIAISKALQLVPKEAPVLVYMRSLKLAEYIKQRRSGNPYYLLDSDLRHKEMLRMLNYAIDKFKILDVKLIKGHKNCADAVKEMVESMTKSRAQELTIQFPTEQEYREWFNEHSDYIVESIDITDAGVMVSYYIPSAIILEEKQLEQRAFKQESLFKKAPAKPKQKAKSYVLVAFDNMGKRVGYYGKQKLAYSYSAAQMFEPEEAFRKQFYLNKNSDSLVWRAMKYGAKL